MTRYFDHAERRCHRAGCTATDLYVVTFVYGEVFTCKAHDARGDY